MLCTPVFIMLYYLFMRYNIHVLKIMQLRDINNMSYQKNSKKKLSFRKNKISYCGNRIVNFRFFKVKNFFLACTARELFNREIWVFSKKFIRRIMI